MARSFPFDRAFEVDGRRMAPIERQEATLPLSEHRRLLELAAASAGTAGFERGVAETEMAATARLARAMQAVEGELAALRHRLEDIEEAASVEAIRFAHAFAEKLSAGLLSRLPVDSIENAARHIFADLRGVPHVAVRVAPDLVDSARERLQAVARTSGLESRLIVLGEPEIAAGDVRIEWADGGLVLDRAATAEVIGRAVTGILGQT
jgi:flagellar assembly protein FliH